MDDTATTGTRTDRSLLEPLSTVVTVVCALMAVFVGLRAWAALQLGAFFGWGDGTVCALRPTTRTAGGSFRSVDAAPGVDVQFMPEYCDPSPDGRARLLSTLTELPSFALYIGALFLLYRLVRGARRDGPFTARAAARLRVLGWWLAAGAVLCHLAETFAVSRLLADLSAEEPFWIWDKGFPFFTVLTGIGLLSLARILGAGTALREDLEGVV